MLLVCLVRMLTGMKLTGLCTQTTEAILKMGGKQGHIMNLGHGIEATTPEEKANFFVKTVQNYKH